MNNSEKKNKVCVVIPFYNELNTIEKVINQSLKFADLVIAVNDGSTDNSEATVIERENVILISYNKNRGKGYAIKKGFEKSMELNTAITVTLDADLQHEPELIPEFVSKINNYDIVIGNRLNNTKDMPLQRIMSNKITSFLLSLKTGVKIIDSQCGYRAFKTKILRDVLPSFNGYEAESEIIVKAARNKYKIGFTNIPAIYGEEKSKMNPFEAIAGFIRVLFI